MEVSATIGGLVIESVLRGGVNALGLHWRSTYTTEPGPIPLALYSVPAADPAMERENSRCASG